MAAREEEEEEEGADPYSQWVFDSIAVSAEERVPALLRMAINLGLPGKLLVSEAVIRAYLVDCLAQMPNHPFHGPEHAFDVTQYAYTILQKTRLSEVLDSILVVSLFLAAIAHDLQHTGTSNVILVNEGHEYARQAVEGVAPLESHHARCALATLEKHGVLANLQPRDAEIVRDTITKLIHATDAARHKEVMERFIEACAEFTNFRPEDFFVTSPQCMCLLEVLLKAADVSNPARSFDIASKWNDRIYAEFYAEGDRDRAAGRNVNPLHDRANNVIAKSSVGFINFVVRGIFDALVKFLHHCDGALVVRDGLDQCLQALDENAAVHKRNAERCEASG